MENKNEWDELKKWEDKKRNEEINKFGLDLSNMNVQKDKKNANKIKLIFSSINLIPILIIGFILVVIISLMITSYGNFDFMTMSNSRIEKEMLKRYNVEVTIFSKVKDLKKHTITFEMNTNDSKKITFTAIEKNKKIVDDYVQRTHKYYFNLWDNKNKKDFIVNEYEENNMLNYETYIEDFDNIEDAINEIISFANYCGDDFISDWKIYIKKDNKKIYPYEKGKLTDDEIINNIKKQYK